MTKYQDVKDRLRAKGMTITRRPDGEFRINFQYGQEERAYYTGDLQDALDTGIAMRTSGMTFEDQQTF
jgi:hypothetical protein